MTSNIEVFKSKKELIEKAEESSVKVSLLEYRESTFLYFIARYFVSVYEAKFGAIPIQVWNEYRNALDHFFRNLTNQDSSHLNKLQGHLQRAVLDILKIYCHSVQEQVNKIKSNFEPEILRLVDNGNFSKTLECDIKKSSDLFILAKVSDNSLGDNSHTNKEIIGIYLDAAYSFDKINNTIVEKLQDISHAKETYDSIHNKAAKGSFWHHIKTHYIFYISWSVITWLIQFLYNHISFQDVKLKIAQFFA